MGLGGNLKPILFNTEMVKAILDGRKTVTRRLIKPQPLGYFEVSENPTYLYDFEPSSKRIYPRYQAGDILYVRETWCDWPDDTGHNYFYKATDDGVDGFLPKWKPSIHMPKEAARIFLKVKDVRVERLQDITEKDACKEGFHAGCTNVTSGPWGLDDCPEEWTAKEEFSELWNSTINKEDIVKYGWDANPWVWVIEFQRVEKPM